MTDLDRVAPSWAETMQQAEMLAASDLVPAAYRGKPANIVTATLYGREIGFGPVAALAHINIIQGKATLSAEGMVAVVRSRGHIITGKASTAGARVNGKRSDNGNEMSFEFSEKDRERAGLNSKTWNDYPKSMYWARAVSQLCRQLFPDVLAGVSYTAEEVGGTVDPADAQFEPQPLEVNTGRVESLRARLNNLAEGDQTLNVERRKAVRRRMRDGLLGEDLELLTDVELDDLNGIIEDAAAGHYDEPFFLEGTE